MACGEKDVNNVETRRRDGGIGRLTRAAASDVKVEDEEERQRSSATAWTWL